MNFKCSWSAPSNIAFVKYWGKTGVQYPVNSNISGNLTKCLTQTSLQFTKDEFGIELYFEGNRNIDFEKKVAKKFHEIFTSEIPELLNYRLKIESQNTFPHSCGIASSASFYASLGLCLSDFEFRIKKTNYSNAEFFNRASYLARLGSGSACRSLFSPISSWCSETPETANPVDRINEEFLEMDDIICLIDSSQKSVSSSLGHSLMDNHPYRDLRVKQANDNFNRCKQSLEDGDWESFIKVVEEEANSLHALMMTSRPSFILLKANTIELIERFVLWRNENKIKSCYTIDAGPNLHILTHRRDSIKVIQFIKDNISLLENGSYIHDQIGGQVGQID